MAWLIHHMDQTEDLQVYHLPNVIVNNKLGIESAGYYAWMNITYAVVNDDIVDRIMKAIINPYDILVKKYHWMKETKNDMDEDTARKWVMVYEVMKLLPKRKGG